MRKTFGAIALVILLAACLGLASPARADWTPGTPNTKWVQMPDLNPNGVDVLVVPPVKALADDFLCYQTGLITDIHIWGSALDDGNAGDVTITLGIWSNLPDGGSGYSTPGALLWSKVFGPTEYTISDYATVDEGEWFWNPAHDIGKDNPMHDTIVKQLNFSIDPRDAWNQVEGTIYWLVVSASQENCEVPVGWKTCIDHWIDGAVWLNNDNFWCELKYWDGHDYYNRSMDLAFAITTVPLPGSVLLLGSGLLGLLGIGGWRQRFKR